MSSISNRAAIVVLAALITCVNAGAEPARALTVRIYNSAGVSASDLAAARHTIETAFEGTGVELTVRQCGRISESYVDACRESLKPLEMVVRIIEAPILSQTVHPDACGIAYVVEETDRGWLATAFSDRITSAAVRVGADAGTLLGLVISHELGHLLLGSGYHGGSGVMRADWSEDLFSRSSEPWRFSVLEAAKMRHAAPIRF